MAITHLLFTHVAVDPNSGRALVNVTDLQGNPTTPDDSPVWTASDGGTVVNLTFTDNWVLAVGQGVGTATVTCSAIESGSAVSGTATVTVSSSGGHLQCAWASGTGITIA